MTELLTSIEAAPAGLTLTALLAQHPSLARRTVQRAVSRLIDRGQITALGAGRARRYVVKKEVLFSLGDASDAMICAEPEAQTVLSDAFPANILISADS